MITLDTTLDSDVVCQVEDPGGDVSGLVIGADDVTLDLGGYTLQIVPAQGLRDGIYGITDDGVPRDRLRIENGSISGFTSSVSLDTSNSVVLRLDVRGPSAIGLRGDRNVVMRNTTRAGYRGIGTTGDGNRIIRNEVGVVEGPGIVAFGSDVRIAHNRVFSARGPTLNYEGIVLDRFMDGAVVANDVSGSLIPGIEVGNGSGALVARNTVRHNLWGIRVASDAAGVALHRNRALENEETGILVNSTSTVVARNTANDNKNLGIDAAGARDRGGNRASRNGNPVQCVGVRCW